MQKMQASTQFKFILSTQQTLNNLNQLKLSNYNRFIKASQIGKQIQSLSKQNLHQQLDHFCTLHLFEIPFIKLQIEDAFISAFNLRNYEVVKFYLQNGFDLVNYVEDAVISITYSLEYLPNPKQAPLDLLQLILVYGANPRYAETMESNTALHLAAQAGNIQFVKMLLQYGADVNAVNDNKQTPLNLALKYNKKQVAEYLKSQNASEKWNQ